MPGSEGFQSTRPRGARQTQAESYPLQEGFNPRARGGRDFAVWLADSCIQRFNPRARGGRDRIGEEHITRFVSFNPRARGGRDTAHLAA